MGQEVCAVFGYAKALGDRSCGGFIIARQHYCAPYANAGEVCYCGRRVGLYHIGDKDTTGVLFIDCDVDRGLGIGWEAGYVNRGHKFLVADVDGTRAYLGDYTLASDFAGFGRLGDWRGKVFDD